MGHFHPFSIATLNYQRVHNLWKDPPCYYMENSGTFDRAMASSCQTVSRQRVVYLLLLNATDIFIIFIATGSIFQQVPEWSNI